MQDHRIAKPVRFATAILIATGVFLLGMASFVVTVTGRYDQALIVLSAVIAAVAGASVAFFTRTLTRVGIQQQLAIAAQDARLDATVEAMQAQRDAMRKQAEVATNVERPFVYVSSIELVRVHPTDEVRQIRFTFRNYGRTPAFVMRIGWGFTIAAELPAVAEYRYFDGLTVESVIRPDDADLVTLPVLCAPNPEEMTAIRSDRVFPWFWGSIQYRDFLGGVSETGFVAFQYREVATPEGLILVPAQFRFRGPAAYTFETHFPPNSENARRELERTRW